MKIGRGELHARIEEVEKIISDDTLHHFLVSKAQPHPQAIEFRAAEKGFLLRLEGFGEFAHKVEL